MFPSGEAGVRLRGSGGCSGPFCALVPGCGRGRGGHAGTGGDRPPWYLPGAPSGSEHSTVTFGYVAVGAGAARLLWCQGEASAWGAAQRPQRPSSLAWALPPLLCFRLCRDVYPQCQLGTGSRCGAAVSPRGLWGRFRGIPEGRTPVHRQRCANLPHGSFIIP